MISYRGILVLIAMLAVAAGLNTMGARAQTSSNDETAAAAATKPYVLFEAVGTGNETESSGSCADVDCPTADTCDCVTWTALPFSSTALGAGNFTAELNLDLSGSSSIPSIGGACVPAAGVGKIATSTDNSMALNIAGSVCNVASPNSKLQFSGSYTITGGIGSYTTSNGVGSATATMVNETGTHRVAWTLIGTISK
ncbi:MAG TPA: hypothetical protein VMD75_08935 [Candidatus Binataceae bacterium]|nr:hypothetical protein [Candidatus Binataceae bacterium]